MVQLHGSFGAVVRVVATCVAVAVVAGAAWGMAEASGWVGGWEASRPKVPAVAQTSSCLAVDDDVKPAPEARTTSSRWHSVLVGLDRMRARAWSRGDAALLRRVYAAGSLVLARDTRSLAAYGRRHFRVRGVMHTFGQVRLVGRTENRARLRVVDTLHPMTVTGGPGRSRVLPRDQPTRHRIELAWGPAGWRISAVSEQ